MWTNKRVPFGNDTARAGGAGFVCLAVSRLGLMWRHVRPVLRQWVPRSRLGRWAHLIHRVRAEYRRYYGRTPALLRPRRFSEKLQWRKLFELDPRFAVLCDRLAMRDYVAARVGAGRQAALLWVGTDPDAIPFDQLVPPYVVKSTHASGQVIIVRDAAALHVTAARATARGWLAHCHGTATHEPGYLHAPHRLVVERLLQRPDGGPVLEHKVFAFDGRARFIRTETPDATGKQRFSDMHTTDWTWLPIAWGSPPHPAPLPPPARLADLIALVERLGAGLPHCRVDIYDCGDELMVSELTLYTRSGMIPYTDPAHDLVMGACWTLRWPMPRALWTIAARRWDISPPRR